MSREQNDFKPRRVRIYKLSTFDTLTDKERKFNNAYKEGKKGKEFLKEQRDELIASYSGVRKVERSRLYLYDYDSDGNIIEETEHENIDKQISLFESEMIRYATDFNEKNPLVMEIIYLKTDKQNEILRQIVERGLDIGEQHYIFYSSTTNQMKRGESILINEAFYNAHEKQITFGLPDEVVNEKGGCNTGKRLAYNGLLLSTSVESAEYEINIDECLVVPDFKTIINEEVKCIDHGDDTVTGIEVRREDIEIPQTDGAGIFLPGVLPTTAQIRCGHIKGCVFPFDYVKFLQLDEVEGVKPNPIIRDIWGDKHNVIDENIKVLLTGSQVKMYKYYNSMDDFKKNFKEAGKKIAINKFADLEPKGYAKTSYQFIQTLSSERLTDDKIEELCKDTLEWLSGLKKDAALIAEILNEPYLSDAIKLYPGLIQDKYIQEKMKDKFRTERKKACGNKLILKDSLYSYICPDLYAFCEWLFCSIENPKGIIPKNYVYNSFYNDKDYDRVDCLRSPHLYMEHGIRNLVKGAELEMCKEWFHGCDTIVSSHDLLCRILMFDVDGDEVLLTPNKTLIECVPEDKNMLYYKPFDPVKSQVTKKAIYNALVASMDNSNIGDISNVMTKNYNNDDTDEEFNEVMSCYNNLTIDFPKTQHNISLGKYKDKYEQLKKEKPPYFFAYAKDKKKASCKEKSNSNCDRICGYIEKNTANKKYAWSSADNFDAAMLCNKNIKVVVKSKKYLEFADLMYDLKRREQQMIWKIENIIGQMDKSDATQEKISRYDVFYDMCSKMILNIFDGDRNIAAQNLIEFEYLQKSNIEGGKNILWNCFGDIIIENIKSNLENGEVIPKRRAHYEKRENADIRNVEKKLEENINNAKDITIYGNELSWIDSLEYRKGCTNDRELLFILLFLTKKNKDNQVIIGSNKQSVLTFGKLDKFIGDGICVAKKGIERLKKNKAISVESNRNSIIVKVNSPAGDKVEYTIKENDKNPILSFYEHNKERKISKCIICGERFIKIGNMKICGSALCHKQQEFNRRNAG